MAARGLMLAAMAPGEHTIQGLPDGEDTRNLLKALKGLGFSGRMQGTDWLTKGGRLPVATGPVDVGASGTALRFLLPWLALRSTEPIELVGDVRLFERPLGPLLQALESLGARWEARPGGGRLVPCASAHTGLNLEVDATASSQFLTGLALAAASLPGGGRLRWPSPPASASYLALTQQALAEFGCASQLDSTGWEIPGGTLRGTCFQVPGDWSGAAAFLCAAALLGRRLDLGPLDAADLQGDRAVLGILAQSGSSHRWLGNVLQFQGRLDSGFEADLSACPDLAPVLVATASLAPGPSCFTGLETLPLKECDRLAASQDLVRWLGGEAVLVGPSTLEIHPHPVAADRAPFDPRNDHRMAFAAAVGALRCGGSLLNPACVAKTLPTFWKLWSTMLGAEAQT